MLLDIPTTRSCLRPEVSAAPGESPLLLRMEHALLSYVRGQVAPQPDHRRQRRARALACSADRVVAARPAVRAAVRRLGRHHRGDPVRRARGSARFPPLDLRARRSPALGGLGRPPLPRDPPARRSRVVPKVMGSALRLHPAARDLRAGRRLRGRTASPARWSRYRCSPSAARSGSSSATGSRSSPGPAAGCPGRGRARRAAVGGAPVTQRVAPVRPCRS